MSLEDKIKAILGEAKDDSKDAKSGKGGVMKAVLKAAAQDDTEAGSTTADKEDKEDKDANIGSDNDADADQDDDQPGNTDVSKDTPSPKKDKVTVGEGAEGS